MIRPQKVSNTVELFSCKTLCLRAFVAIFFSQQFLSAQTVTQNLNQNWIFSEAGKNKWLTAKVPGTIHTDLLCNNEIPDPFIDENEKQVQWVETKTWEYKSTFDADKKLWKQKHKDLIFEGLDTYAFIYLNDSLLLTTENMFRTYRIDVTKILKKKKNVLRIVFHPASELIELNKSKSELKNLPGGDRVFIRKAAYQFGWDFGPRLVTCGIWKPIHLEGWNNFSIRDAHVWTETIDNDTAGVAFSFNVSGKLAKTFHVTIKDESTIFLERDYSTKDGLVSSVNGITNDFFFIPHPRLWWCNGIGKPEMYNFQIIVTSGKSHDAVTVPTGIRTLKLITVNEKMDSTFYFELNGYPVFIKGANWIPPDNFIPRVTNEKYYSLIKSSQQSNMNMLRVWGGGEYEDDKFYDMCDSLGIMVWQDFMFACGMYPYDNHFLNEVGHEANDNIIRIENHPCIALWCGNNENSEGWENWDWQKDFKFSEDEKKHLENGNKLIFDKSTGILCGGLLENNFTIADYWPTSPMKGWGNAEAYKNGDVHYWGVWWGMEPFSAYENHVGRFMSEYGFQSMPSLSSCKLFDSNANPELIDSTIIVHQKNEKGFATINEYMQRDYPVPTNFSDYVYISQVMQRDAMTKAIEAHRRAMPYCMGTLFWQFDDCWPGTTWSAIDYYGQPKLMNYALKDLYASLMISVQEKNDSVFIYAIDDDTNSFAAQFHLEWKSFDGKIHYEDKFQGDFVGGKSNLVEAISEKYFFDSLSANLGFFEASCYYNGRSFCNTIHYFVNDKNLKLNKNASVTGIVSTTKDSGNYVITLQASSLAKNVYMTIEDFSATFSDNGFDLMPGEIKKIKIASKLSANEIQRTLKIQTMNQFSKY